MVDSKTLTDAMVSYQVVSVVDGIKTIHEQGLSRKAAEKLCTSVAMDFRYAALDNHAGKFYANARGWDLGGYNLRTRSHERGTVVVRRVEI